MATTPTDQFLTTEGLAKALGKKPATVRGWLRRKAKGQSVPAHPAPAGKINGGWVFDAQSAQDFIDRKEARSNEV